MVNYSKNPHKLKEILRLISIIYNVISRQSHKNNPIGHYLDKHEGVPLWVIVNYITLGNIQNFYMCIDESLQNVIAREFSKEYKRNYDKDIIVNSEILINILKTATLFRNVCAHEERLYNFKLHKPARSGQISKILEIESMLLEKGDLFTMVGFLKLVLDKREYIEFIESLDSLFIQYSSKFEAVKINDILNMMGFVDKWKSIVLNNV